MVLLSVIILFQVVLPVNTTAIWGTTWNGTAYVGAATAANLSAGNSTLSTVIQTLLVASLVVFVALYLVRGYT